MELKRRNLDSMEQSKLGYIIPVYRFVQQYISHLLPALKKIECECEEQFCKRREHEIRIEVDMALALSARGFSWSLALRSKLERARDLAEKNHLHIFSPMSSSGLQFCEIKKNCKIQRRMGPSSPSEINTNKFCFSSDPKKFKPCILQNKSCQNLRRNAATRKAISLGKSRLKVWRPKSVFKSHSKRSKKPMPRKIEAKKALNCRIKILRSLTPGGGDMDTDVLFQELGNYIASLQVQVKVLNHLVESSAIKLP